MKKQLNIPFNTMNNNRNRLVITSLSTSEAITKCVMENSNSFTKEIDVVLLQDFLLNYDIYDELNDNDVLVKWYRGSKIISNKTHNLLNRIQYIPDFYFNNYIKKDRVYAKREFEAYIKFAFNAFNPMSPRINVAKPINNSFMDFRSLPQQWHKVGTNMGIDVPKYFLGPSRLNNLCHTKLIYSDIYNLINWSQSGLKNRLNALEHNQHVFCFEKPQGQPVFLCALGQKYFVVNKDNLSDEIVNKLLLLAQSITSYFSYFISEILFFVDDAKISFGCINPEIIKSTTSELFQEFICVNLIKEYQKWHY